MEPTPAAPRVHLQSPQTAVPTRAVEPGRTRRIAVAAPPLPAAALQRRTRVVLYYRADAGEKGASRLWEEAMWAKESLSEAVADHPEMAGRLRRHADGSWALEPVVTTEFTILEQAYSRPGSLPRACAPTSSKSTGADNI